MPINPNSAWHRMYVDIPTSLALELDEWCAKHNIAKKTAVSNAITQFLKSKPVKK